MKINSIFQFSEILRIIFFVHENQNKNPKPKPELEPEPISKTWRFLENEYDFDATDPDFKLGDEIQKFNYKKLVKVKPYQGRKRIVEESDEEDSYTDSLEEGDSERDIEYVFPDIDDDNENTVVQKEID
jgi:hypothetical protein